MTTVPKGTKREEARRRIEALLRGTEVVVGEKIPSVDALAEQLELGRMGVQQAVKDLAAAGIVKTMPGKGTYLVRRPAGDRQDAAAATMQLPDFPDVQVTNRKRLRVGLCGELPWHETVWRRVSLAFMKRHPEIELELMSVKPSNGDWEDDLDIVQVPSFQIRNVVKGGHLFDPSEIGGLGIDTAAFYEGALAGATFAKMLWGVPTFCAPTCLYCNSDLASQTKPVLQAGSWWEAMAIAQDMASADNPSAMLLSRSPAMMMVATGAVAESYHSQELFEREACQAFWRRLAPFYTDPGVFGHTQRGAPPTPALWDAFTMGQAGLLVGTSSWIRPLTRAATFPLALRPIWTEPNGSRLATVIYTCIHSATPFPLECRQFLAYLASAPVMEEFARRGQPVGHRQANRSWTIQGADAESAPALREALEASTVCHADPHAPAFYGAVIDHELTRWQRRDIDTDAFLAEMQQRGRFFYRSRDAQQFATPHVLNATGG